MDATIYATMQDDLQVDPSIDGTVAKTTCLICATASVKWKVYIIIVPNNYCTVDVRLGSRSGSEGHIHERSRDNKNINFMLSCSV